MNDDRYQFQPWPVKSYRWLRWMPLGYAKGAFGIAVFIFRIPNVWNWCVERCAEMEVTHDLERGSVCPRQLFWQVWGSSWNIPVARAEYAMGHYFHLDEIIADLKAKGAEHVE